MSVSSLVDCSALFQIVEAPPIDFFFVHRLEGVHFAVELGSVLCEADLGVRAFFVTIAFTMHPAPSANDGRVTFLTDFGWDVTTSPVESGRVRIPEDSSEVFDRYNTLQKSQGYDLSKYAGKSVMRYVYQVNNYPGASAPVYATVLVHKDQIIGGDVTDTSPGGKIRGFTMPEAAASSPTATTASTETTQP